MTFLNIFGKAPSRISHKEKNQYCSFSRLLVARYNFLSLRKRVMLPWQSRKKARRPIRFSLMKAPRLTITAEKVLCTIRSHDTKSRMLGRKLHSGTSETKAGQGGLVRAALFSNLRPNKCDFAPCDRVVPTVSSLPLVR